MALYIDVGAILLSVIFMTHFNINPTQHRILSHLRDNGEILLDNGYHPRSLNEVIFALVQNWVKANPAKRAYLMNMATPPHRQPPTTMEEVFVDDDELQVVDNNKHMTKEEESTLAQQIKEYKSVVMPELPPLRAPVQSIKQTGIVRDRFSLRDDK